MPLAVVPGDAISFIATSFAAESSFAALDSRLSSLFPVLSASGFSLEPYFLFMLQFILNIQYVRFLRLLFMFMSMSGSLSFLVLSLWVG